MTNIQDNRLQLVHCNELFPNFDRCVEYVNRTIHEGRKTLYGEPMVLRYGDYKNPNVVLAISSTSGLETLTDSEGVSYTSSEDGSVYFIDITSIINNINDLSGKTISEIERSTVEDKRLDAKIDSLSGTTKMLTDISDDDANILTRKSSGLFVSVDLEYKKAENKLILKRNNQEDVDIHLSDTKLLHTAYYDANTEELVLVFEQINGDKNEVRIPVRGLINEWGVNNSNKTVTLQRVVNQIGTDELSAEVNISNSNHNILQTDGFVDGEGRGLFVRGEADNIYYSDRNGVDTNVDDALDALDVKIETETLRATTEEERIENDLNSEISRATGEENKIKSDLKAESERATLRENQIESTLNTKIDAETSRAMAAESDLNTKIDTETSRAIGREGELDTKIDSLSGTTKALIEDEKNRAEGEEKRIKSGLTSEIERATLRETQIESALNTKIDAESERAIAAESVLNTKIEDETSRATEREEELDDKIDSLSGTTESLTKISDDSLNLLVRKDSGLYVSVELSYDSALNKLTLTQNGVDKEIQLNEAQLLKDARYNSQDETIELFFTKPNGDLNIVKVPVRDLINEWDVDNSNATVTLTKTKSVGNGNDTLKANVNISTNPKNILTNDNGNLFVEGIASNIIYKEIDEGEIINVDDALDILYQDVSNKISKPNTADTPYVEGYVLGLTTNGVSAWVDNFQPYKTPGDLYTLIGEGGYNNEIISAIIGDVKTVMNIITRNVNFIVEFNSNEINVNVKKIVSNQFVHLSFFTETEEYIFEFKYSGNNWVSYTYEIKPLAFENFTPNKVLVSNEEGKFKSSEITTDELNNLSGLSVNVNDELIKINQNIDDVTDYYIGDITPIFTLAETIDGSIEGDEVVEALIGDVDTVIDAIEKNKIFKGFINFNGLNLPAYSLSQIIIRKGDTFQQVDASGNTQSVTWDGDNTVNVNILIPLGILSPQMYSLRFNVFFTDDNKWISVDRESVTHALIVDNNTAVDIAKDKINEIVPSLIDEKIEDSISNIEDGKIDELFI